MDRTKSEDYKSVLIAFLIAAALVLGAAGLPAQYGSWLVLLSVLAAPVALGCAVAGGGMAAGGVAAVLCFAVGCLLDYKLSLMLAALSLPFAFTVGYVLRKKIRFRHSVLAASGAALAGTGLAVGVLWLMTGELPVDFYIGRMGSFFSSMSDAMVRDWYQLMRSADLVTGAVTQTALDATSRGDAIVYLLSQFKEYVNMMLVGMLGIYALLMGLIGYLIPHGVLKRRNVDVAAVPAFSDFALPNRFWLAFLLSYLFAAIGAGFGWKGFDILEVTVYALYALVLTVQGLAFLDYMYKRRKMGKTARIVLHVLALLISALASMVGSILMWVGIFENMAKLRKRLESKGGAVM